MATVTRFPSSELFMSAQQTAPAEPECSLHPATSLSGFQKKRGSMLANSSSGYIFSAV